MTKNIDELDKVDEEHLKNLQKAADYSYAAFDKNLLYITSGALGLSVAFIDNIIDVSYAQYKYMLITAWVLFTLSILISLILHLFNSSQLDKAIENYYYQNDLNEQKRIAWHDIVINVFNWISTIITILGIIILIIFISINL